MAAVTTNPGFPPSDWHQRPQPTPTGNQEGPAEQACDVTSPKQPTEHLAESPYRTKHLEHRLSTPPITASPVVRARRRVLMKIEVQRRRDPLPLHLRARQAQPAAPTPDLAPLRARPARLDALRIRPVRPATERRICGLAGRLHRGCLSDVCDFCRQPLTSVGDVARRVHREKVTVRPAPDHYQIGLRSDLAPATTMLH